MFSAFKKLTGRSGAVEGSNNGAPLAPPPGLTTMSHSLQKKFGKGVHYNMKIILKGDRNVGKSQLFRRLQGLPFLEEYTATEEIQVANITWNYKTSDDIVKVEIWDVVDVANRKKRLPSDKLKLENTASSSSAGGGDNGEMGGAEAHGFALDANTIDVYKNTNGVILVFDITKSWTYDYVKREIESVPEHIPILIMGNRRDMGHHRAVASDTVIYFIEGLERESAAEIRYIESSMRNGFGLKYIHKFFNLPYLHLQREALLKQLEVNRQETEITIQELDYYAEGDEANYDLFIDSLAQKRRLVADALSPPKLTLAEAQAVASAKALRDAKASEAAAVAARLTIKSDPTTNRTLDGASSPGAASARSSSSTSSRNPQNGANSELNTGGSSSSGGGRNAMTSSMSGQNIKSSANNSKMIKSASISGGGGSRGVEDFVPEDDIQKISSFLDDGLNQAQQPTRDNGLQFEDSSDEEDGGGGGGQRRGNPMVAAVEEDIDFKDLSIVNVPSIPKTNPAPILSNSSSEDENENDQTLKNEVEEGGGDGLTFKSKMGVIKTKSNESAKLGFQVFVQDEKGGESSGDSNKEKKSNKKSHKKGKHHKKKKEHHHKHHTPDLEEFLSGEPGSQLESVDTSAYEAL